MVMHIHRTMPIAVVACAVLEREVELYARGAEHIRDVRIVEMGLHERPARLREQLQAHLDEFGARADIEAIALVYGLCGLGMAGLQARKPFVIPRAHDCITIFMGGKELLRSSGSGDQGRIIIRPGGTAPARPGPGTAGGVARRICGNAGAGRRRGLARGRTGTVGRLRYGRLYRPRNGRCRGRVRRCAALRARWLGWKFERLTGDPGLLRDLLWCAWDRGRFQVVRPGMCLAHVADGGIMTEKMPDAQ